MVSYVLIVRYKYYDLKYTMLVSDNNKKIKGIRERHILNTPPDWSHVSVNYVVYLSSHNLNKPAKTFFCLFFLKLLYFRIILGTTKLSEYNQTSLQKKKNF